MSGKRETAAASPPLGVRSAGSARSVRSVGSACGASPSTRCCAASRRPAAAFTLLEVLLALALASIVLVSLNTFIFSMSELWGRGGEDRLFDKHVRAVTRFVERTVAGAALPGAFDPDVAPVVPFEVKGAGGEMLTFELPAAPDLLPWPEQPLPEVVCALGVQPGEGLVLYWHSRLEKGFNDDPPRAYPLSSLVTGLSFDYYETDTGRWVNETQLRAENADGIDVPRRLRLTFAYAGKTQETVVTLPQPVRAGLPSW